MLVLVNTRQSKNLNSYNYQMGERGTSDSRAGPFRLPSVLTQTSGELLLQCLTLHNLKFELAYPPSVDEQSEAWTGIDHQLADFLQTNSLALPQLDSRLPDIADTMSAQNRLWQVLQLRKSRPRGSSSATVSMMLDTTENASFTLAHLTRLSNLAPTQWKNEFGKLIILGGYLLYFVSAYTPSIQNFIINTEQCPSLEMQQSVYLLQTGSCVMFLALSLMVCTAALLHMFFLPAGVISRRMVMMFRHLKSLACHHVCRLKGHRL